MKSLLAARKKLEEVTPLLRDCGKLCGSACCRADEDGLGGMLLFPGEEAFYATLPEGFVISADVDVKGASLLTCEGYCKREDRPLACRLFPLLIIEENGEWTVALDPRAWPVCPLMPSGMDGLSQDFIGSAKEAALILSKDAVHRQFIANQAAFVKSLTKPLWDTGEGS